jgi:Spy/CpxP family protein refolding chaperone
MNRMTLLGVAVAVAVAFLGGVAFADTKAPGPLGLPSVETLKEKLTLTEEQTKKVETIYDEYKDKAKEVEEKGDPKKKAEVRHEIVGKIKDVCTGDQKKKLEEIVHEKDKK